MIKLYTFVILVIISAYTAAVNAKARSAYTEDYYNRIWCQEQGGVPEFVLGNNKRVDCLLDNFAVEADWANHKTYESLLQALYYAKETDKIPGILLIIKDEHGMSWVKLLKDTVRHYNLVVPVWYIVAHERISAANQIKT
jgi:hypothetical protein